MKLRVSRIVLMLCLVFLPAAIAYFDRLYGFSRSALLRNMTWEVKSLLVLCILAVAAVIIARVGRQNSNRSNPPTP